MKTQTTTQHAQNNGGPAEKPELIQKRAYELYLKRGQKPGHELEDWLQAERDVSGSKENLMA